MKLVNFIIIGSMKCGTTTLSQILGKHPQISFSRIKEPDYFYHHKDWKSSLDEYHGLFDDNKPIWGEGSTSYTKMPEKGHGIWKRIHDYNHEMKFIYMFRNPADRLISQFNHMTRKGYIKVDLSTAIKTVPTLLDTGRYATQIQPYLETFGKHQILFIDFDDFNESRPDTLKKVANFLELGKEPLNDAQDSHGNNTSRIAQNSWKENTLLSALSIFKGLLPNSIKSSVKEKLGQKGLGKLGSLSQEDKDLIYELNRIEIEKFENIIGKSLDKWNPSSVEN